MAFWKKKENESEEKCPLCGTVVSIEDIECPLCFYELKVSQDTKVSILLRMKKILSLVY